MKIPQKHIPARFVSLIPPEFPAAKIIKQKKQKGSSMKQLQASTLAGRDLSLINSASSTNKQAEQVNKIFSGVLEDDVPNNIADFDGTFDWRLRM